jgi:DNA topoisomerase-2
MDIIDNLYRLMDGEEVLPMHPWYRGFNGIVEQESEFKYKVTGTITQTDETTVEITGY